METKLDLVNHLLQVVGERRVLTLTTGHPSVVQAIQALDSWDRDFQGKGWWFNTNKNFTLACNNVGEVLVPTECLEFTVTAIARQWATPENKTRYVRRGARLYDSWENTYTLNTSVQADLVMQLAIEDLPQCAATYLKHWAAQNYYVDDDGDLGKADRLKERTMLAWHSLKAAQLKAEATNALDSPAAQSLRYRIRQQGFPSNPMFPGGS
jgi:hypothetical protein